MHRLLLPLAIGAVLAGCARDATPATGISPATITCHLRPVYARAIPAAGRIELPGSPDGIAASPTTGRVYVAIQSGTPRIAVVSGAAVASTIAVPSYVSGMRVTPDGRYVLGATATGAVVINATSDTSNGQLVAPPTGGPGAAEAAITPDSRYAFISIEGAGRINVLRLGARSRPDAFGRFIGSISVGSGALGLAVSPDGRYLYSVSEGTGSLSVISIAQALTDPSHSVLATTPAPCAPVRVAVSPDGDSVYVTARDGNELLRYSAALLLRHAARALTSVIRVGASPLGVAVVPGGRFVLVADMGSRAGRSGVSVINARTGALLGTVTTGHLADAITFAGRLAFVTASNSDQIDLIDLSRL